MTDQKPKKGNKKAPPTNAPPIPVHHGNAERQQHLIEPQVISPAGNPSAQKNESDCAKERKDNEEWNRSHRQTAWGIVINSVLIAITGISILVAYRSLKITQGALTVSQKQFESANQPYLQISDIVDSIGPNRPPIIKYTIDNLVSQPAKIILGRIGVDIMRADTSQHIPLTIYLPVRKIENFPNIQQYAIKESPYTDTWTADNFITENEFHLIDSGFYHVFFYGDIVYLGLVATAENRYHFRVELLPRRKKQFQMLENDNKKISDTPRTFGELIGDFLPSH